ncbi:hypothetical protein NX722_22970 [Endozoicomonas gorgoniicola]|uniref:Uncharacterized protein n=1 Tax=Endozoicomonas gorgoniicola TaxID=1234144 RepID=A0ABT3N271_9GAMM|nr:hypothetical protein [Endozoicomonas gorgoniicola]MCW7555433.1 hypothetical protein [Endozoicomonas gorgoniicola]
MSIKDIPLSNNQKKRLLACVKDQSIFFQDENGDIVVDTQAYKALKESLQQSPIEELLKLDDLETLADYVVFQ